MAIDSRSLNLAFQFAGFHYCWNLSEITARMILAHLLGNSETARSVCAEIQNRALCDALRSAAKEKSQAEIRSNLEHFVKGYAVILEYRNYYTHSFGPIKDGEVQLFSISSKGRLKFASEVVGVEEMNEVVNHASKLVGYGALILDEIGCNQPELASILNSALASPEKPEWPRPPKKTPRYLQEP